MDKGGFSLRRSPFLAKINKDFPLCLNIHSFTISDDGMLSKHKAKISIRPVLCSTNEKAPQKYCEAFTWCHQESNRGHEAKISIRPVLCSTNEKAPQKYCEAFKWCHQESNRGHKDFQSFALPTELWHRCFLFASAKVGTLVELAKCFAHFFAHFWACAALSADYEAKGRGSFLKMRRALAVVTAAMSAAEHPYTSARRCRTRGMKAGSLRWPRWGVGAR